MRESGEREEEENAMHILNILYIQIYCNSISPRKAINVAMCAVCTDC